MTNFINELRNDHTQLIDLFNGIKSININAIESSKQLQAIKANLLVHIRKENDGLYTPLRERSFNNLQLQRKLDIATRDTARISASVVEFLDRYSKGGSSLTFRRDFNRLSTIFTAHMRREEALLFGEYADEAMDNVA